MMRQRAVTATLVTTLLAGWAAPALAQMSGPVDSATIAGMRWRSVGPANMMGRIADIRGVPSPSRTFYVLTAAGGLWKTTNAGTTFKPLFQNEAVVSGGNMAIAPSDSMTLYLGTGEPNSRNSISPGAGVYKSTDGGESWKLMGLEKTQAIGRIVVHPTNPNIAYVAALGAIWNSNPERGLYKTTDGGTTWTLSKFISDKAGFVDVAMDPSDPNHLLAASWERVRGPYFLQSGGPGSGLWRTRDGGATWTEVKGGGFPATMKGRIGLGWSQSNPRIIYALVEADTMPNARPTRGAEQQKSPSGLYKSEDAGATWTKVQDQNVRPFYYSQVRVDPKNPDKVFWSSTPVMYSDDGGKTARTATQGMHVDHHAMWIDPVDPNFHVIGNDGGVGISFDGGRNYNFVNIIAVGQFYNVSFDMAKPYNICGGLQDNGSWCGPSRRQGGSITNTHWFNVGGGDGFVTQQDPTNPAIIYSESQGGSMSRRNIVTGERSGLSKPNWRTAWLAWQDSIVAVTGTSGRTLTAAERARVAEFQRRATKDSADLQLRWNWNTPYLLSPHNPTVFYAGSNRVMKSVKSGDEMYPISPDLTTNDTLAIRISTETTGGITTDATGAETYGTIVSLNESAAQAGLLYAGTDDGNVWMTRNDGGTWENLTGRFPGVPAKTYVSRIEPSSHSPATVYITFDNHRRGDFTPYVYVSNDFGATFRSITNNLPKGGINFVHVIREDPTNPNLLFVGTDVGLYVSVNRGASWQTFMTGLPTTPIHDLKIHPRDHELIAATHGRAFWIADILPLQQMNDVIAAQPLHLFEPRLAYQFVSPPDETPGAGDNRGHQVFRSISPPYGAEITYRIAPGQRPGPVRITVSDAEGELRTLTGPSTPGIHTVVWNYQGRAPASAPLSPAQRRDSLEMIAKMDKAIDSLVATGMDRAGLDSAKANLTGGGALGGFGRGGGGGGFGGGGGTPGVPAFDPDPGFGNAGGGGFGGGGGGGGGGFGAGTPMGALVQALGGNQAIRAILGGGGGGFGGFGGGQGAVGSGTYLVTVQAGNQKQSVTLRVEGMP